MKTPLRILLVEDSEDDALLLIDELERNGYAPVFERVETPETFVAALEKHPWDVVISDFRMPHFSGVAALQIFQSHQLDIPFIISSGTIGEEAAVEAMKAGAHDYVTKGNLLRLIPALSRELRETEERRERCRAQTALQESEQRFRQLATSISEVFWMTDVAKREILYISPAYEKIWGRSCKSLYQNPREWVDAIHPDDRERVLQHALEQQSAGDYNEEYRIVRPDGSVRWILDMAFPILNEQGRVYRIAGIAADITGRKLAEQSVRESETRLTRLIESAMDGIMTIDSRQNIILCNLAAARMFGCIPEEAIGQSINRFIPERFRKAHTEHVRHFGSEPMGVSRMAAHGTRTISGLRANGEEFPIEASISHTESSGQQYYTVVLRDITERIRTEKELRESENRYRELIDNARDAIFTLSRHGEILSLNPAFESITGWPVTEWINRTFPNLVHPEDQARSLELFRCVLSGEKPPVFELRISHRAGSYVPLEFTVTPRLAGNEIIGVLGIARDVTERRRLEEQFRQAQKMEAVGQLSSGVAHDFNNILTVIHGNASLLLMADEMSDEWARQILLAAERASSLTRQLLLFSRKQAMQSVKLDLNWAIGNITKMLQRLLGEDISLQSHFAPGLPLIQADQGMMEQVLLNLAVNSRDAMPKGGKLTVETSQEHITETQARTISGAKPGHFVCLSVSDTGTGIAPEHLSRVFEPFFTTKEAGKGTGLGLATVYGIVQQHHGWIQLSSELGKGTTFRCYFPALAGAVTQAEKAAAAPRLPTGTETILLVEDEPAVCQLALHFLQRQGYNVLTASSGVNALALWQENKQRIQLLFTDMVLPDSFSGRELANRLLGEDPELKVLYTSGYSADISSGDMAMEEGVNFLQKPYSLQKLVLTVRSCLDRK